jgi:hypothetical protein
VKVDKSTFGLDLVLNDVHQLNALMHLPSFDVQDEDVRLVGRRKRRFAYTIVVRVQSYQMALRSRRLDQFIHKYNYAISASKFRVPTQSQYSHRTLTCPS